MENFSPHTIKVIIFLVSFFAFFIFLVLFLSSPFHFTKPPILEVSVTIPEGFDNSEIAGAFALKLLNFNQSNFLLKATDKEGYLFPDTYFFFPTGKEK